MAIITSSCNKSKLNIRSTDPLIQLGEVKFTGKDISKNFNSYWSDYKQVYNSNPPKDSIISQFNKLLELSYIVADAYDHEIDSSKEFLLLKDRKLKQLICDKEGALWNATIVPKANPTEEELKEAYLKRQKVYYTLILDFTDSIQATDFIKEAKDKIKSQDIYSILGSSKWKNIPVNSQHFQWPFSMSNELNNIIDDLKQSEFSQPLQSENGYSVLFVESLEKKNIGEYKKNKEQLQKILFSYKSFHLGNEAQEKALKNANIKLNPDTYVKYIYQVTDNSVAYKIDAIDNIYHQINSNVLFEYINSEGVPSVVAVKDFNNYYYYSTSLDRIKDSLSLDSFIASYVIDEYFMHEAKDLNLPAEENVVYQLKEFSLENMYHQYKKKIVLPGIEISDDDILNFYYTNPELFKDPTSGEFCIISTDEPNKVTNDIYEYGLDFVLNKIKEDGGYSAEIYDTLKSIDFKNLTSNDAIGYQIKYTAIGHPRTITTNNSTRVYCKLRQEKEIVPFEYVKHYAKEKLIEEIASNKLQYELPQEFKEKYDITMKYSLEELAEDFIRVKEKNETWF